MTEQELILFLLTILCGLVSIGVSFLILLKNREDLINQLLFLTFGCWAINIVLLGVLYGKIFDTAILNLIRDIETTFGIISGVSLFLAGYALNYGESQTKRTVVLIPAVVVILLASILGNLNDYVDTVNKEIVSLPLGSVFIFILPGLLALGGIFYFYQVYRSSYESLIQKRILFFMLGSFFLIFGALNLGLRNLIPLDIFIIRVYSNIFYTLGPISVLYAFYRT